MKSAKAKKVYGRLQHMYNRFKIQKIVKRHLSWEAPSCLLAGGLISTIGLSSQSPTSCGARGRPLHSSHLSNNFPPKVQTIIILHLKLWRACEILREKYLFWACFKWIHFKKCSIKRNWTLSLIGFLNMFTFCYDD